MEVVGNSEWPARKPSQDRSAKLVTASGRVALGLAAVLFVVAGYAYSRSERLFDCDSPWPERFFVPGGAMFYLGALIIIVGLVRAARARSWANARMAVSGLYLLVCSVAFAVLAVTSWPGPAACD